MSIVTGDFNGDGIPDLVVANSGSNSVTILLGDGAGHFTPTGNTSPTGTNPDAITAADFNGDGVTDLAVVNSGDGTITILIGDGTGTFTPTHTNPPVGKASFSDTGIATGDFNGDGIPDLAVANASSGLTILLGNGDGTFVAAASPVSSATPVSIAVGDFNGDGIPDLATANSGSNNVTVLLGKGDGTFTPTSASPATGSTPESIVVADLNGDGNADLAVTNINSNSVTVLLGDGKGNFTSAATSPSTGTEPRSIAIGDFNGDGIQDLAVANWVGSVSVTVLLSETQSTTATATGISPVGTGTHQVDASYGGDTNYSSSTSGTTGLTAQLLPPRMTLAASSTSVNAGAQVTFTATVGGNTAPPKAVRAHPPRPMASSTPAPTGTVNFLNGTTSLGVGTLNSSGVATLATTKLPAGKDSITASYAGDGRYSPTTSSAVVVSVIANPAPTVGLSSSAISATYGTSVTFTFTATGSGTVPTGTVTFLDGTTQLGTKSLNGGGVATYSTSTLKAGTHSITASYPGDSHYGAVTSTVVTQTIKQAVSTIIWTAPSAITYGTALTSTQLDASASVPGSLVYSPTLGSVPAVGSPTLSVTFTPTDAIDYTTATAKATLLVSRAPLTVTANNASRAYGVTNPSFTAAFKGFVNGDTVSVLSGSPAFATTAIATSPVGTYPITVTLGSLSAANYIFKFVNGTLNVTKATPAITWALPAAITYGTALSATQLDATSPVTGTFTYTPAIGKVLTAGTQKLSVSFAPNDMADYTTAAGTTTLVVNQATPKIIWATPVPVSYGTKLSVTQLNASSTTAGTFSYSPAIGVVPGAGSQTLTATFTPKDTVDYATSSAKVTLVVNKVSLTVTANIASRAYGAANPAFTATYAGFVNGDTAAKAVTGNPSLTTTATGASVPSTYPITAAVGSLAAVNYTFKFAPGTLTVTKALLTVTATSASVAYNQPIPKLGYTVTGFANSDTSSILKGAPVETTAASKGSNYGVYPITITQGTLTANSNYGFQFVNGTLTITALGITATPVFHPAAEISDAAVTVTLSDATTGAVIYYTTDGSTPSTSSTKYSAAISVAATKTIHAIAVAPGYSQSTIAAAIYTIQLPAGTPVFKPVGGTYPTAQSITISDATAGATIYYTTNGTTPTTSSARYTGAIAVPSTETLKATATAVGYSTSALATAAYSITGINFEVLAIPANATNIYMHVGNTTTAFPIGTGQSSIEEFVALPAGTYTVRVVATGNNNSGNALAGAYAASVTVSGVTPLTLSLSPESIAVDPSTPSTVPAGSIFTATVDITDPAHWFDGIVAGFRVNSVTLGQNATCGATSPGRYKCTASSLQAPAVAGTMPIDFWAWQNIPGPFSIVTYGLSWTIPVTLTSGIHLQIPSLPPNVTSVYVLTGNIVTAFPVSAGETSFSGDIGLPIGTYTVRVVATGSNNSGNALAGAYAAGVAVSGITPLTLSLSPESIAVDPSTPSSLSAGGTFAATVDITDPAHWFDGIAAGFRVDSVILGLNATCGATSPGQYKCTASSLRAAAVTETMPIDFWAWQNIPGPVSFVTYGLSWTIPVTVTSGIRLQIPSLPPNVTSIYALAGSTVTAFPVSPGTTSFNGDIGVPAGTYTVRVVATGSNNSGNALAGAYAAGVTVSGITPLTLSLSPESIAVDPSTPSTVPAGSIFAATVDITDPAHWFDGIAAGFRVDSVTLGQNATCGATSPGQYKCTASSLQAAAAAGTMPIDFWAWQNIPGPVSFVTYGMSWTMQVTIEGRWLFT